MITTKTDSFLLQKVDFPLTSECPERKGKKLIPEKRDIDRHLAKAMIFDDEIRWK